MHLSSSMSMAESNILSSSKLGLHGCQPTEQEQRPPSPPIWSSTAAIQQALPSLPPHRLTWESTGANIAHDQPHVRSTSCSSIRSVAPLTCRTCEDHGLLSFSSEQYIHCRYVRKNIVLLGKNMWNWQASIWPCLQAIRCAFLRCGSHTLYWNLTNNSIA